MIANSKDQQSGVSLIFFILIIALGITAYSLNVFNASNVKAERERKSALALAEAKEALIGYASAYREKNLISGYVLGHLPCPDMGTGTEGSEASSCGGSGNQDKSVIGKLPWKTLGIPPLRDGDGECLWYAVSGTFKANTKTNLMNWDTLGQFQVLAADGISLINGTQTTDRAVAIIFSPGSVLANQSRTAVSGTNQCGGNYDAANYLDAVPSGMPGGGITNTFSASTNNAIDSAANQIKQFITGTIRDVNKITVVNDKLLSIRPEEIFARKVEKRTDFPGGYFYDSTLSDSVLNNTSDTENTKKYGLLQKIGQCIVSYGKNNSNASDKRLLWAAPMNVSSFTNDSFDDQVDLLAGRPAFIIKDSDTATSNTLVSSANSYRLLTIANCPNGWSLVAGDPSTASQQGWWDKWKDHFFYAVADRFKPSSSPAISTNPCSDAGAKCLTVDGHGPYAAVLIFSGKKVLTQVRDTIADKQNIANYLEGQNASAMQAPNGNNDYTKSALGGANDMLICIKPDLSIDSSCTL